MFDLRYHVASLAAVFLALIIGILVGVGIADRGYLDKGTRGLLERQNADLQTKLDKTAQQAGNLGRDQATARAYISETYPVLVRNRLRGKRVAVVFVGSVDGGVRSAVTRALTDAGGEQLRLRALTVPIDGPKIDATLAAIPRQEASAARALRGTRWRARPGADARRGYAALERAHRRACRAA